MVYSVKQKLISCKPFLLIKFHCFFFAVIEMTMQKTSLQNSILTDSIRSHFKTHLDRNKTILISHCQNFLNRTLQKIYANLRRFCSLRQKPSLTQIPLLRWISNGRLRTPNSVPIFYSTLKL